MKAGWFRAVMMAACLAVGTPATAQFGHPLKGSWLGDWGQNKDNRTRVFMEIQWDGKALSGTLNPGANGVKLQTVTVNPDTWAVHFEGEGKDKSGATIRYVIDGKLENIGAYQRFITGTWSEGSRKGDFRITRS